MHSNPIEVRNASGSVIPFHLADPYVIRYAGCYYCYSTAHDGVTLLVSPDLFHFTYVGYAMQNEAEQEFWAPCVVYHNGTFYMYYSSRSCAEDDVHMQRLKVATSNNVRGPFVFKNTLCNSFSIDADVNVSDDGEWTIFYATNDFRGNDPRFPGTCIVEDKLITPFSLSGKPREVIVPSRRKELFCVNRFGDGRDWYTVEGPCLYEHLRKQFLLYSGNAYTSEHYFVDYAQKEGQLWRKRCSSGTPLLSTSNSIMGTGHNSIIKSPSLTDDWIVFHGMRTLPEKELQETRELCISRLIPANTHLRLMEEPFSFLHRPWLPEICCFTELSAESDPALWKNVGGAWHIEPKRLSQSDTDAPAYCLLKKWVKGFVCEVSIQAAPSFRGGICGITAAYVDSRNYTNILLHTGRKEMQILNVQNGICHLEAHALPEIDFSMLHTLKVERTDKWLSISLDDQPVIQSGVPWGNARVGLVTMHTAAEFYGFTFNECYQINAFNFKQAMRLFAARCETLNGITFGNAEKRILCGTDPTTFTEDLGVDWQFTVEVVCCTPFAEHPVLRFGLSDKASQTPLCSVAFDFEQQLILITADGTQQSFAFEPHESGTIIFVQKNEQLYVNGDGGRCLLPYICDSRVSISASGEFELLQIKAERIY